MREILFRGKRIDNGEWICGDYVSENPVGLIRVKKDNNSAYFGVFPESVGQYIGKRDENGKRIFEGDILSWNDGNLEEDEILVIFFDVEEGQYKSRAITSKNYEDTVFVDYATIIGNIIDNPELLENIND